VGELCVASPILRRRRDLVANALMAGDGWRLAGLRGPPQGQYAAELFQKATLADVNAWVSRKTEGKIDKILDRPSDVVLINASISKPLGLGVQQGHHQDGSLQSLRVTPVPVPMIRAGAIMPWSRGKDTRRYGCL